MGYKFIMKNLQIKIEELEQKRSKWLIIGLIGFCIWDGLRIVDRYILSDHTYPILTGMLLLGWLIWSVGLIKILQIGKKLKHDKHVNQILNDELVELNRLKSWRFSLLMIGLTQVFIVITSFVTNISGILAAELSIFVLVISAIGGFLYYNRDNSESNV